MGITFSLFAAHLRNAGNISNGHGFGALQNSIMESALGSKRCLTNAFSMILETGFQESQLLHGIITFQQNVPLECKNSFFAQNHHFTQKVHPESSWVFINASIYKHLREGAAEVNIFMESQLFIGNYYFLLQNQLFDQKCIFEHKTSSRRPLAADACKHNGFQWFWTPESQKCAEGAHFPDFYPKYGFLAKLSEILAFSLNFTKFTLLQFWSQILICYYF